MTFLEHKDNHVWIKTPTGFRCAYMMCNAKPDAKAIATNEAEEAQRRAVKTEIRYSH